MIFSKRFIVFCAMIVTASCFAAYILKNHSQAVSSQSRPDILFVIIDTLRADHLSCYNYNRPTSPNIDNFAKTAVLFENTISACSSTFPSISSIMTGVYPFTHGASTNFGAPLRTSVRTISQRMTELGYNTAAFISSTAIESRLTGLDRGFAIYDEELYQDPNDPSKEFLTRLASATVQKTSQWLSQVRNNPQPVFLFVHLFDPHGPYTPPAPYNTMFNDGYIGKHPPTIAELHRIYKEKILVAKEDLDYIVSQYDGEVRYTDYWVEQLLQNWQNSRNLSESMIILTADHGDDLYQHNYHFFHIQSLYESCMHVPLMIKFPSGRNAGVRIPGLCETIDILPTIMEELGVNFNSKLHGASLFKMINNESQGKPYAFSIRDQEMNIFKGVTLRTPNFRYVYWRKINIKLFNREIDPLEQNNLLADSESAPIYSEASAQMSKILLDWVKSTKEESGVGSAEALPTVSLERLEKLRSLGYIMDN